MLSRTVTQSYPKNALRTSKTSCYSMASWWFSVVWLHKVTQRRHQEPQRFCVTLCILGGSSWYGYTKLPKEGTKNRKDFVLLCVFLMVLCGMVTQSCSKKTLRTAKTSCYSVASWWFSVAQLLIQKTP
jgi:hypothetical protein